MKTIKFLRKETTLLLTAQTTCLCPQRRLRCSIRISLLTSEPMSKTCASKTSRIEISLCYSAYIQLVDQGYNQQTKEKREYSYQILWLFSHLRITSRKEEKFFSLIMNSINKAMGNIQSIWLEVVFIPPISPT